MPILRLYMSLLALGISHQTAPLAIREQLAFTPQTSPDALLALRALPGVEECAIISTCNRTEIYASGAERSPATIIEWLHRWHGLRPGQFREYLYSFKQQAAVIHLFKVAAAMDSMILGEPQISGQVKQAWQQARHLNTLGMRLDRLFQHAFATAKQVRSQTGIGHDPVTLPYAALRLARQIFGELGQTRALMIGAGEIIEECVRYFHAQGLGGLTIANRSPEKARRLAQSYGATCSSLDDLPRLLCSHDLVIACTASAQPVLKAALFGQAVLERRHRPIFALDLGVPRNIEAAAADHEDVYLYSIDDLRAIIEASQKNRQASLAEALRLVESAAVEYERWLNLQASSETLKDLRRRAGNERDRMLVRALQEIQAGQDPEAVLRRFGHRLVNRLLHAPSVRLRQAAEAEDRDLLDAARYFFSGDNP